MLFNEYKIMAIDLVLRDKYGRFFMLEILSFKSMFYILIITLINRVKSHYYSIRV